jgi:DNA-binding LacI/PurR family transcriptional regulator
MSGEDRNRIRKARVTVKDLARDLSLSTSTISRAFYDDAVIAPSTRKAVLTRAAEIGYAPNPLARSLITKRTRIAGVVTSDITNPFYPEVLTRLTEKLREIDLNVMLSAAGSSDSLDDAVKLLLSYQPDVVIVLAATLSSEAAEACGQVGTPVLFFNRRPFNVDAFGVTCDNVGGGLLVADHLIKLGHRRLAFVAGRPDASTNVDRWEGFRRGCVDHGLEEPVRVEAGAFAYERGYEAASRLLGSGSVRPDGVFCANDILAIGFMDAARREFGLDIPGDLSVVGFDDIAMARWPSHALTTVRQPVGKMIDVTMQLIEMLFDSAQLKPRIERIPGELVERASTREVHHAE